MKVLRRKLKRDDANGRQTTQKPTHIPKITSSFPRMRESGIVALTKAWPPPKTPCASIIASSYSLLTIHPGDIATAGVRQRQAITVPFTGQHKLERLIAKQGQDLAISLVVSRFERQGQRVFEARKPGGKIIILGQRQ